MTSKLTTFPSLTPSTLYLRCKLPPTFSTYFSVLSIMMYSYSHFILYVNENIINSFTYRIDSTEEMSFQYILPIHMFESNESIIAIEVHRIESNPFPGIKFFAVPGKGDSGSECKSLNFMKGGVNEEYPVPRNPFDAGSAYYAFHPDGKNYWYKKVFNEREFWVIYSFGNNTYASINEFIIMSGSSGANYFPVDVVIEHYTNDQWEEIAKVDNFNFTTNNQKYSIPLTNEKYINTLRFNFTCKGRGFEVGGIYIVNCRIYTCSETNFLPETRSNSYVTVKCPNNSVGNRVFFCPYGKNPEWREIENNCEHSPILLKSENYLSFTVSNTIVKYTFFSISGKVNNVTIEPSINIFI